MNNYKGKTVNIKCNYKFDASFEMNTETLNFYNTGYDEITNNKTNLIISMNNTNNQLDIHPEIQNRLYQYISNGILNTIFYGGPGVGKHTLILNMFRSLNPNLKEKEKVQFWEETGVRIYSTSNYIRFDAKECVRKKANLPKIIEEISRTRDISADSNKIIYIRYINYLGSQQEAFRQLVEDTFDM